MAYPPSEESIRKELGEILDGLGRLPKEEFEKRAALLSRQTQLRSWLRDIPIDGADEFTATWSYRAGRKTNEEEVTPVIISPGEGGQAGG